MINNYTAGGHIEAWCTKCRLELGHTIVAMVANSPKKLNAIPATHNTIFVLSRLKKSG